MRYRVVFGGQRWIEAASEPEAYQQFWAWVREQCDAQDFGLVVEGRDEEYRH
jgi:hypothetical protein